MSFASRGFVRFARALYFARVANTFSNSFYRTILIYKTIKTITKTAVQCLDFGFYPLQSTPYARATTKAHGETKGHAPTKTEVTHEHNNTQLKGNRRSSPLPCKA
jgi:hypothetical protein